MSFAYGADIDVVAILPIPTLPERKEMSLVVEVPKNHGPVGALRRPSQFLLRLALEVMGAR